MKIIKTSKYIKKSLFFGNENMEDTCDCGSNLPKYTLLDESGNIVDQVCDLCASNKIKRHNTSRRSNHSIQSQKTVSV